MSRLFLAVLAAATASAQVLVDASRLPDRLAHPEKAPSEKRLGCKVIPVHPLLDFSFRFQSGYIVQVPLKQYEGPNHRWAIVSRVTPQQGDRKTSYLVDAVRLPPIPAGTKASAEFGGAFLLGPGKYRVEWTLFDDSERVCRSSWTAEAQPKRGERGITISMPRDTVGDLAWRRYHEPERDTDVRPISLTVMLHAAPLSPRRTILRATDRMLLLGLLSSLLDALPARSVRLVVLNLDQQKELLRKDNFTLKDLDKPAQAMNELQLGTVDYRILQNRKGHIDLLTDLLNQETSGANKSDVVIFLGPEARSIDNVPAESVEPAAPGAPRFYYFQYKPFYRRGISSLPDIVKNAVSRIRGKTITISTPSDFAKAIDQVKRRVNE